jgi:hypothetical protein
MKYAYLFSLMIIISTIVCINKLKKQQPILNWEYTTFNLTINATGPLGNITGPINVTGEEFDFNILLIPYLNQNPLLLQYIPSTFWINPNVLTTNNTNVTNITSTSDFIVLKTYYNTYLTCDVNGNVNANQTSLNQSAFWGPTEIYQNIFALRSWYGGLLGVDQNGNVVCMDRQYNIDDAFNFILTTGNCTEFTPRFLILQNLNNTEFLSVNQDLSVSWSNSSSEQQQNLFYAYYDSNGLNCLTNSTTS